MKRPPPRQVSGCILSNHTIAGSTQSVGVSRACASTIAIRKSFVASPDHRLAPAATDTPQSRFLLIQKQKTFFLRTTKPFSSEHLNLLAAALERLPGFRAIFGFSAPCGVREDTSLDKQHSRSFVDISSIPR
ncbi:hypothetical protein [Gluconacetobacter sp.]|uniref:hypothetical protein n=1 Tax=Gluconacetobacter sp. TaxID=1935994 RepID=UPI0039E7C5C8